MEPPKMPEHLERVMKQVGEDRKQEAKRQEIYTSSEELKSQRNDAPLKL